VKLNEVDTALEEEELSGIQGKKLIPLPDAEQLRWTCKLYFELVQLVLLRKALLDSDTMANATTVSREALRRSNEQWTSAIVEYLFF